jgi:hypothetical protein
MGGSFKRTWEDIYYEEPDLLRGIKGEDYGEILSGRRRRRGIESI